MEALILSAGDGSRLSPLTKYTAKGLIKILGVPILERVLHNLKEAGIKKVTIVVGHLGDQIKEYFGNNWKGIKLDYVRSKWYGDGVLKSMIECKDKIKGRFLFICGDTIVSAEIIKNLIGKKGDVIELISNPKKGESAVALVSKDNRIKAIGNRKTLKKWNKTVPGVAVYNLSFWKIAEKCIKDKKYERLFVNQGMIDHGYNLIAYETKDEWFDIDTHEDLKKAKRIIFEKALHRGINRKIFFKKYFTFPVTSYLTKLFVRTGITPNQITILVALLYILGGILLSQKYFFIGGLVAYLGVLLDGVDGRVARLKYLKNDFGGYIDWNVDIYLGHPSIIFGLTYGIYSIDKNPVIIMLGAICIFLFMADIVNVLRFRQLRPNLKVSWHEFVGPAFMFRDRELTYPIIIVSSLFNYPIIGLIYYILALFIVDIIEVTKVFSLILHDDGIKKK